MPKNTVIEHTKKSTPKRSMHFMYWDGSFVCLMIIPGTSPQMAAPSVENTIRILENLARIA